jgi:acetyl esterase/lipase
VYPPVDDIDRITCRPDFALAVYPGHLSIYDDDPMKLNADIVVTPETPPTFLVHAEDDPIDRVEHTLAYYKALRANRVPVEMHLYAAGGHAFGLRPTDDPITHWTSLADAWLASIGVLHP